MGQFGQKFSFLKSTPNVKQPHIEAKCISRQDQMIKMFYPNDTDDNLTTFRARFKPFCEDLLKNVKLEEWKHIMWPNLRELYIKNGFELEETVERLVRWMHNLYVFWGTLRSVEFWQGFFTQMEALEELGILLESCRINDGVLTEGQCNIKSLTHNLIKYVKYFAIQL